MEHIGAYINSRNLYIRYANFYSGSDITKEELIQFINIQSYTDVRYLNIINKLSDSIKNNLDNPDYIDRVENCISYLDLIVEFNRYIDELIDSSHPNELSRANTPVIEQP